MSDIKAADNLSCEKSGEHQENSNGLHNVLRFENAAEMEKQIVRKLDMWMLPQLLILYMFNYLNRTNIAQARLDIFDEDLGLQDGDYQIRIYTLGLRSLTL